MDEKIVKVLDKIFNKTINSSQIHECLLLIENSNGDFSFSRDYGKNLDSPMLLASITKLLTTACILMLQEQERLSLSNKISQYFDDSIMNGLNLYNNKDYSHQLTISDLLFQVSGLPDAFEEGKNNTKNQFLKEDTYFEFEDYINRTKMLKPHFAPGTSGRAYYADINFDLLGIIIEKVTHLPLEEAYKQMIFEPLGLNETYLPISEKDFIPNVYYKDKALYRPKSVISSRASGGGVTTARELMTFLKAFFNGRLFSNSTLNKLKTYNKLQASMGPIYYGGGFMQIPLEGLITLFMGKGELLGHSGSTGSFAFYYPYKDLFIVGDVNQMANPALHIRMLLKVVMAIK